MLLLEKKIVRLVEERGYMGTKYISTIKKIINYIQEYIKTHEFTKESIWEFSIPHYLTKKIDCVDLLDIEVTIENDSPEGGSMSGGGSNAVYPNNQITINGKLEYGRITLNGYSINKNLYVNTIFNSFSHELNHLQEIHTRMLKRDNAQTIYKLNKDRIESYKNVFSNNPKVNKFIEMIFYRLFTKSEFNVLINGLYGDLEGHNSNRFNFNYDIKHTEAYAVYNHIKNNLYLLNELSDEDWDNIRKSFNMLSADGSKPRVDIKTFKNAFKKKINQKLIDLLKGIGKMASFYYDRQEMMSEKDEVLIMDDPSSEIKI